MQWFAAKYLELPPPPVTGVSLETAIEKLAENLERLKSVLVDSTKVIDELRKKITVKNLEEAEKFFKRCTETLPVIEESCKQQSGNLEEIKKLMIGQITASHRHSAYFDTMTKSHAAQNEKLDAIRYLLNQKDKRDALNRRRFRHILDVFKGYGEDAIR